MEKDNLIPATEICLHYNIEVDFITSLQEYGLIELTSVEEIIYIDEAYLNEIEKMIRLHYDLNINLEGIDAITQLIKRLQKVENEIYTLRNRLRLYAEL